MSKPKEQSAIDAIYEMLDMMSNFEKRLDVIDSNIKLLNNKVSKLQKTGAVTTTQSTQRPSGRTPEGKPAVPENINTEEIDKLVIGKVKAYGYIVNKDRVPLGGVVVNVYRGNDSLRSLKTDDDGRWEARLPSGKYGIEYIHKKFKPINRTIEIPEDVKEFEVR